MTEVVQLLKKKISPHTRKQGPTVSKKRHSIWRERRSRSEEIDDRCTLNLEMLRNHLILLVLMAKCAYSSIVSRKTYQVVPALETHNDCRVEAVMAIERPRRTQSTQKGSQGQQLGKQLLWIHSAISCDEHKNPTRMVCRATSKADKSKTREEIPWI